ncbi:uncharacterized protein Z519_09450 [Cladophialophora bantiana CBS 173.52]|uniref:Amidohydrolase-related domain-containing protein n=1 Tax=Cladophialophora bantiana (strain ATCC 10958 / CBS 173.52 / CDC B-1940 / NIH 8579) TaxID=1442370 RepID=A0A0D2HH01_CLAB1|nr:uncharacterized protein Z519_09450 [Cladophialophora bantiana CBS 173.52]KIW90020.1 hypothetical protein Z519_09450 [Cladophialophora bantiana CBS 173.52]
MAYSLGHGLAALAATLSSGIESILCLSVTPRLKRWDTESVADSELLPPWFCPFAARPQQRTELHEDVKRIFETARDIGAKIITSHLRRNNIAGMGLSAPKAFQQYGLLKADIILSHATGSAAEELDILRKSRAFVAAIPGTESQMAHGEVIGLRKDVRGSIGADCRSCGNTFTSQLTNPGHGKFPKVIEPTTEHAFNLATILGARAAGVSDRTGSLVEGKAADIIVIDGNTPAMCCAFEHDPLVTVVRHAGVQEIDVVIVAGKILKEQGRLVNVAFDGPEAWDHSEEVMAIFNNRSIHWSVVAGQLRSTRLDIQKRIDACDMGVAKAEILKLWGSKDGSNMLV